LCHHVSGRKRDEVVPYLGVTVVATRVACLCHHVDVMKHDRQILLNIRMSLDKTLSNSTYLENVMNEPHAHAHHVAERKRDEA
jgi:hypothetical protein